MSVISHVSYDRPIDTGEELVKLTLDRPFNGSFHVTDDEPDFELIAPANQIVAILKDLDLFGKVPLSQVQKLHYTRYPNFDDRKLAAHEKSLDIVH